MRVHISIPTNKMAESVAFFERVFDTPASKTREDYANFRLDTPPIHLAFVQSTSASTTAPGGHYGIELPDHKTLEEWRLRADQNELALKDDPDASCCYARADKFWLSDPNGYNWEFWVRTGESEVLHQEENTCC